MTRVKNVLQTILVGILLVVSVPAAQAQEVDPTATELFTTEVAIFQLGDDLIRLWASIRNQNEPPIRWQFRYDPLFVPALNEDGTLAVATRPVGNKWETRMTILLDSEAAQTAAYARLQDVYPDEAEQIRPENIFAKPVRSVKIVMPQIAENHPNSRIANPLIEFHRQANDFAVVIESPTQQEAETVADSLADYRLRYSFAHRQYIAARNRIEIDMSRLQDSKLLVELDGMGSTEVYVHREDLRTLTESIAEEIIVTEYIEDPALFRADLLNLLLSRFFDPTTVTQETFDEAKWEATYNADDLRPDVIEQELNRTYRKDETTDQWRTTVGGEVDVSLLGGLIKELGLAAEYSQEGLELALAEEDILVEFQGNRIIVKAIQLYRVNVAQLKSDNRTLVTQVVVRDLGPGILSGTLDLAQKQRVGVTYPELFGRTNALEQSLTQFEQQVDGLSTRLDALDTKLTTLESATTGLSPQITALQSELTALDEAVTALDQRLEAIEEAPAVATAEPAAGTTWLNPADGVIYVYVPAGMFTRGSTSGDTDEQPVHDTYLDAFWIMRTEVTNAQYAKCVAAGACPEPNNNFWDDRDQTEHPVVDVSWDNANAYARWAGGRLPTEAEWEKACRGTDARVYPWGNAWLENRASSQANGRTRQPVGTFPQGVSPYGALDMAGNVWEWTADWYDSDYYSVSPERNPSGPENGDRRVVRGGSFSNSSSGLRCADRGGNYPTDRGDGFGFRLASPGPLASD